MWQKAIIEVTGDNIVIIRDEYWVQFFLIKDCKGYIDILFIK